MSTKTNKDLFDKCRAYKRHKVAQEYGVYPFFRPLDDSEGSRVLIEGKPRIMLGSNNYLGLTHHPEVIAAAKDALDRFGTGCTGSRMLNGTLNLHNELEEELARGERLPAGERVRVPEAPPETLEAKDALIGHGEALGARGRGLAPLDSLEEKTRTTEKAGRCPASRACTDEPRGLERPSVESSALKCSNLPPVSELLIVERNSFTSVLGARHVDANLQGVHDTPSEGGRLGVHVYNTTETLL